MMTAKERVEAAKRNANVGDEGSMTDLFNAVANYKYLSGTKREFGEMLMSDYLSYYQSSWGDGLFGDEWETVEDCIDCAEEAASQALEAEVEGTNQKILQWVYDAINMANISGDNWADVLDAALVEAGVELADDQPDGSDPTEIIRLADGRMIYLADQSATGADQYAFSE